MMNASNLQHIPGKNLDVFKLPKDIQPIHRQYGLWICRLGQGPVEPAGTFYKKTLRYFEYYSISHVFKGGGMFIAPPGDEKTVKAGQCIILTPNQINKYGGASSDFHEDFINFSGPVADQLLACNVIQNGIFQFGYARRLLPIIEMVTDPSRDCQIEANLMLQRLLFDVYIENRRYNKPDTSPFERLLAELKANIRHWWTVKEMAEFCQISDDQLRRNFVQYTGMRPKQYLDQLKMTTATIRLNNYSLTIGDIAEELGYIDRFHFSRRFKQIMGVSPQQYRERYGAVIGRN